MTDSRSPVEESKYSCHTSLAENEPLWAHATRVDAWLCLGYDRPWGSKALRQSELPPALIEKLIQFEEDVPNARVQFIRQSGGLAPAEIPLFLCRADTDPPWLKRMTITHYEELLGLDLIAAFRKTASAGEHSDPIFLTCVNGRRDLCCARYGQTVSEAFEAVAPASAWQTTHLGGHRFAATSILLPFGLHYGRLRPADVPEIVRLSALGQLSLKHFRGRTTFPNPVQAAEHQLRLELGLSRIDDLTLLDWEKVNEGSWRVRFGLATEGREAVVAVKELAEAYHVITTTGRPEAEPVGHFEAKLDH